jgi:pyruvate ferredoxin oxidoreductase gamma subunit
LVKWSRRRGTKLPAFNDEDELVFLVRIHGRGGQGVVSAAELLAVAAFKEGRHAQAFPSFGSERTGAPVVAFCRIDDKEIRSREPVARPNALIIQDATLLHQVDLFAGVPDDAYVLINSTRTLDELGLREYAVRHDASRLCLLPATDIAMKHVGRPVPNVPLLGGFAAVSGVLHLASVIDAIREKFPPKIAAANAAAATEAFNDVRGAGKSEPGANSKLMSGTDIVHHA